jgi:hypothetical protein
MDRDSSSPHLSLHRRTLEINSILSARDSLISITTSCVKLLLLQLQLLWICYLLVLEHEDPARHLASTLAVVLRAHMAFGKECSRTTKEYKPGLPILPFLTMSRRPCKKAITSLINAYCTGPLYQWLRMYFSFAASSSYWSMSSLSAFGLWGVVQRTILCLRSVPGLARALPYL